jgi:hypothetical protein
LTPGQPGDRDDAIRANSYRVIVTNTANPPAELKNTIVSESGRMERAGSAAT